jgi:hypothetical protein
LQGVQILSSLYTFLHSPVTSSSQQPVPEHFSTYILYHILVHTCHKLLGYLLCSVCHITHYMHLMCEAAHTSHPALLLCRVPPQWCAIIIIWYVASLGRRWWLLPSCFIWPSTSHINIFRWWTYPLVHTCTKQAICYPTSLKKLCLR